MMSPKARQAINETIQIIREEHTEAASTLGHTGAFKKCPHPACRAARES